MKLSDVITAAELVALRDQADELRDKIEGAGRITHLSLQLDEPDENGKRITVNVPLAEATDPEVAQIMQTLSARTRAMLIDWVRGVNGFVENALERIGIEDAP